MPNPIAKLAAAAALLAALAPPIAPAASAAGIQVIDIPADAAGPALTGAVWTPCGRPAASVSFGPMVVTAARDCPVEGAHFPLVVISHGVGGWAFGHHDVAEALADAGFVVAAIDHSVDSGPLPDHSQFSALAAWISRPKDIRRLTDFMLDAWPNRANIDPARIGFFGFSRGGFTGLVLVGGEPDFEKLLPICPKYPGIRMCSQLTAGERPPTPFPHDPRIRAAFLADPVLGQVFDPERLKGVIVPVSIWRSELGGDGVQPEDVLAIAQALPFRPSVRTVADAGHFAFLAPCGPAMAAAAADICTDAPGFDRVAFHAELDRAVVTFFRENLTAEP